MRAFKKSWAIAVLSSLLWIAAASSSRADSLDEALEREAQLLRSEKNALQQELNRAKTSADTARNALTESIDQLGAELARLNSGASTTVSPLVIREKLRRLDVRDRRIIELTERMGRWLDARNIQKPEVDGPERLPALVASILTQVEEEGSLDLRETEYFAEDGTARRGPVLHVGGVAAIAWEAPFSPLVAEPGGTLRMIAGVTPSKVEKASKIEVQAILFDPTRPAPTGFAKPSRMQRFQAGGALMWVLAGLALAAAFVALERAVGLWLAGRKWRAVKKRAALSLNPKASRLVQALAAPLIAVAEQGEVSRQIAHERAAELLVPLRARLMARLPVIATVAAVAPLVGLLGTVTGMIATFSVLTTQGSGDPQSLSGGISEALLTTQLGLAVAVPTLLAHTILKRWAQRISSRVEVEALDRLHGKTTKKITQESAPAAVNPEFEPLANA